MFHVINTHYDDAGIVARAESSWLIRRYAHDYVQNVYKNHWEDPSAPIILLGDFSESSLGSSLFPSLIRLSLPTLHILIHIILHPLSFICSVCELDHLVRLQLANARL